MIHCLEVMHERIAHNFYLDLAAAASTPVALQAPDTGDLGSTCLLRNSKNDLDQLNGESTPGRRLFVVQTVHIDPAYQHKRLRKLSPNQNHPALT